MNLEKQKLLLSYCIASPELYWKVSNILEHSYFDPTLTKTAKFIRDYYTEYKDSPSGGQIQAEVNIKIDDNLELSKDKVAYAEKEIETFCRNKAIEHAILEAPGLLAEGNFAKIEKSLKEAISICLKRDMGLDYFLDPEGRLKRQEQNNATISTGYVDFDEAIGGGLNKQEITIISAGSGVGKSLFMGNVTRNVIERGLNVVYISLELAEDVVGKRYDSMFTGIGQVDLLKNITQVSVEISKKKKSHGKLTIKRMPESITNANHIRSYLKEYELVNGFLPDVLAVDYLDIMASVEKISVENVSIKDKYVTEELRALGHEFDIALITASQQNRGAMTTNVEDLGQSSIAGGLTKIFTADNVIALIQDDKMKAMHEYMCKCLKTRSAAGVGKIFMLNVNPTSLLITTNKESNGLRYAFQSQKEQPKVVKPVEKKKDMADLLSNSAFSI